MRKKYKAPYASLDLLMLEDIITTSPTSPFSDKDSDADDADADARSLFGTNDS